MATGNATAGLAFARLMALERQALTAGAKLTFLGGTEVVQLTNATLSVGQDTGEATAQQPLVEALLGRGNDSGGISFYDAELTAGASRSSVATQMLASQDYAADAGTQAVRRHPLPWPARP